MDALGAPKDGSQFILSIYGKVLFDSVLNEISNDDIFATEANGSNEDSETFSSGKGPTEASLGRTIIF